jgi:serine phosphatase RsbU (regulator of sigma subunit)
VYAFSVAAIDDVGNIGDPAIITLVLNKYIPSTAITTVSTAYARTGELNVTLLGQGFTFNGTITAVYFDADGAAPYDYVFTADERMYSVTSDGIISGINILDIEEGAYRVGLVHSDRGLYFTRTNALNVINQGTIKLGNYSYRFTPEWSIIARKYFTLRIEYLALYCVLLFAVIGLVISIRGIRRVVFDSLMVRHEIKALLTGEAMPHEKEQKTENFKQKGMSLRVQLVGFTILLVLMVILLVSIPLGLLMQRTQEQTLGTGLSERVNVLLESLASQARMYLPQENILDLSFVPDQASSLPEANFVTITGLGATTAGAGRTTHLDYVWATNDPNIDSKIDTETLAFGSSRHTSDRVKVAVEESMQINQRAITSIADIAQGISELNAEALSLVYRTDTASIERALEVRSITSQLTTRLNTELNNLSKEGMASMPHYDSNRLDRSNTLYLFYKPVLYRSGTEQNYVRGIVFVEISTENLIVAVNSSQARIFIMALTIGLIAIAIGAVGSLIVSTIMVNPIRHLVRHVAMIRDTEDKEKLEGKDIIIKSKDEIGMLGETVNDMTHGLIKAAAAAKDLTVGKELQKMFIPLETDTFGNKLTTGSIEDDRTHFFGYYEGAKGVSGDYFDYKQLDDRWFAVIKCDVSGKGVPASLIMVEVATLFLNYFQDWSYKKDGTNLTPIVSRINDLIESRGFKGRFAAFTLCLLDSISGECHFCNAGDNIVHLYDSQTKKKKNVVLPETPASGVFPTFMVDAKGGFSVHKLQLNKGDVLFLYTDGIEEAKRLFRDKNFEPVTCAEPGLKQDDPHGNHSVGQDGEEMSPERVNEIIEAVFNRKEFMLEKWHNPVSGEKLVFDFSTCKGTSEDVILALVSVEKIFRMNKPPTATSFDRVQVDRKIDLFLKEHFKQYEDYCMNHEDIPDAPEYMYYTHVKEDPQYDDLTLVAIKIK